MNKQMICINTASNGPDESERKVQIKTILPRKIFDPIFLEDKTIREKHAPTKTPMIIACPKKVLAR
jgi:hypothetical protein